MGKLIDFLESVVYILIIALGAVLVWKCINAEEYLAGVLFGSFIVGLGIFLFICKMKMGK